MSDDRTARAWKDPEDAARATAPAHPSGEVDLALAVGGLADEEGGSEALGTAGCCPTWATGGRC
ncbi:hypothetical protein ABZW03_02250 [Kitasatospora sp. NPDC004799]|uniref:hypothetical protein n=1 Tax=Kitasatospora sp. NPDC004799 TaxID=3154460 RepID=UPI0033A9A763